MRHLTLWLYLAACAASTTAIPAYAGDTASNSPEIRISEVMASNATGLRDGNGETSDWVELTNTGDQPVQLEAWSLTDDPAKPNQWRFPAVALAPGAFLTVFLTGEKQSVAEAKTLHANFKLSRAGEYIGLYRPGPNAASLTADAIDMPEQYTDISYGRRAGSDAFAYFDPPSPGADNQTSRAYLGRLAPPAPSQPRGFYTAPFELTLEAPASGAEIRYTRDGAWPGDTTGTAYTDALTIKSTTVLRAVAFKDGYLPSPPVTFTYLFTVDVAEQAPPDDFPEWLPVRLNPAVIEESHAGPEALNEALRALPILSIGAPHAKLFGEHRVWLRDEDEDDGSGMEVLASLEILYPDERDAVHLRCGLKPRGGQETKRALECQFRSAYGPTQLEHPPFPRTADGSARPVNSLILRSGDMAWGNTEDGPPITYARDEWGRRTQQDLSGFGARGGFVHLYLNGLYFGVYNAVEEPDDAFAAQLLGGDAEDTFITKYRIEDEDAYEPKGNPRGYFDFVDRIDANDLSDPAAYAEIQKHLDIEAFIDYLCILWYSGATDMYDNNWYAFMRTTPPGPLRWLVWDVEATWWTDPFAPAWKRCDYRDYQGHGHVPPFFLDDCIGFNETFELNPILFKMWRALWRNADFRMQFADRVTAVCTGDGALSPRNAIARWREIGEEIRPAILAEAARWGGLREEQPRTPAGDWEPAVALVEKAMTDNATIFLDRLRAVDFLPSLPRPQFRAAGGPDTAGPVLIIAGAAEHQLNLGIQGSGSTEPPAGAYAVLEGQPLQITARPAAGYLFREWRGDIGNADPETATIVISADRDCQIEAVFEVPRHTLVIASAGSGETVPLPGSYPMLNGAEVEVSAKASPGGAFLGWTGAVDSSREHVQFVVNQDMRIEAGFRAVDHTLTITIAGEGETIPGDDRIHGFRNGARAAVAAVPEPGWFFDHWEGDIGDADPAADPIELDMDRDRTLTGVFARWRLDVAVEGKGRVEAPGEGNFAYGENVPVHLNAVPNADAAFSGWVDGGGAALGDAWDMEIVMDRDREVRAVFGEADYTLTVEHEGGGLGETIPPAGVYGFKAGQEFYVRRVPGAQIYFGGWDGDASGFDEGVFVVMNANKTVTARFGREGYPLELAAFGHGGMLPGPGVHALARGSTIEISPTQFDAEKPFQYWAGDIGGADRNSVPLVLTVDKALHVAAVFPAADSGPDPAAEAKTWIAAQHASAPAEVVRNEMPAEAPDDVMRIYYTLDGSDPRAGARGSGDTGGLSAHALAYTGPITLSESAHIRSRLRRAGVWGAKNDALFTVGPLRENLRITEIMYHDEDGGAGEFIEISNIGNETVNLALAAFTKGIAFRFPRYALKPGARAVVVGDHAAFTQKYGEAVPVIGAFSGRLDNQGERIRLEEPGGAVIADFVYEPGWYPATDGGGHSLVAIDAADPQTALAPGGGAWAASSSKGGTPGEPS